MVSVLNTLRFDSGYLYGVSLRSLLEVFSAFFDAMLGSTVDTSLCVKLRRLVFLVTLHLALCSFVVLRPSMLGIMAGMDQKECYVSLCTKLRIYAVAVPHRSSISCCGAEANSHGLAVQQTMEFPQLLRYMWSMSRLCSFPGGLQFSDMLTTCPLLATTGAELDSVENLQRFRSCSSMVVDFLVWDVDMPAVGQSLALMVQTVQMPVEVPQVQVLGEGCAHARYCASSTVQKPVEFSQVLFWDKDVDMLAVVPVRFLVSACR